MEKKTALLAGATGLIGNHLLHVLLDAGEYDKVITVGRRPLNISHPKLEEVIMDLEKLDENRMLLKADDVYCCLGTTMKKAGSREAMFRIDVGYPAELARVTREEGAKRFLVVSSMNADPDSPIWYSRMKGELEQQLLIIGFPSLSIFRPSLLLGNRSEFRLGERAAAAVSTGLRFLFQGPLRKFRAIKGSTVAKAMYLAAQKESSGVIIYSSEQIEHLKDSVPGP
ncbi:oxidoreductase [Peribacillus sp. SCS-37]|uniref:oxidoreductase n=1 Tax=Paraperibacillus esterisolvens TaxID=3115296 RepID=UPI003905A893